MDSAPKTRVKLGCPHPRWMLLWPIPWCWTLLADIIPTPQDHQALAARVFFNCRPMSKSRGNHHSKNQGVFGQKIPGWKSTTLRSPAVHRSWTWHSNSSIEPRNSDHLQLYFVQVTRKGTYRKIWISTEASLINNPQIAPAMFILYTRALQLQFAV